MPSQAAISSLQPFYLLMTQTIYTSLKGPIGGTFHAAHPGRHNVLGYAYLCNRRIHQTIKKSSWSFNLHLCKDIRLKLKTGRELPTFQFIIPQKDRNNVPIPTVSAVKGTDSLSVRFNMENKCVHQVGKLKTKGSRWLSRLNTGMHINPHDVWSCVAGFSRDRYRD